MTQFAFVFPGQGSQSVGMLDAWGDHPVVAQTLKEASDAMGEDVGALIHSGPKEALALTTNTQPVMLVAAVAAWRVWRAEGGALPAAVAGHSLGEYSALVASGVLTLAQAAPLVRLRAAAMQEAVPVGVGAMAAVLGLEADKVKAACAEVTAQLGGAEVVEAVNFNDPGQTVIAGSKAAVEAASVAVKAAGAKRALPLPVSAPFHSSLMKPAAAVELTHENMRLGAVQGKVLDSDGKTIYDWFDEFGISRPSTINFDFAGATAEEGKVRTKCNDVIRTMMRASAGAWLPGQTYAVGLCGDDFFDDLTGNAETRSTYLNQQEASDLRNEVGQAFGTFRYGNILFINYRGTDDKSTVAIKTDECQFFPVGAPDAFRAGFSPAEFLPFVNTPGQEVYAMVVPDLQRQAWVRPEVYSYPLFMCTRPGMLLRAKRK